MRMWAVQANIEHRGPGGGWSGSRQLPTFYLHPSVQGTLTEGQAVEVARDLIAQVFEATLASVGKGPEQGAILPHVYVTETEIP